MYKQSGKMINH